MKLAIGILTFVWLLCGLIGAWRMNDLDLDHWKVVAWGPFSLAEAFNENPVQYPGP